MIAILVLGVLGFAMCVAGCYELTEKLDVLWQRAERQFRARGITNRERTPEWERATRNGGWFLMVMGVMLLIGSLFIGAQVNAARRQRDQMFKPQVGIERPDGTTEWLSEDEATQRGIRGLLEPTPQPPSSR